MEGKKGCSGYPFPTDAARPRLQPEESPAERAAGEASGSMAAPKKHEDYPGPERRHGDFMTGAR